MNNVLKKVRDLAETEAKKLNLEILEVEWVNEYGNNILRIIADSETSLDIDQATALNEAISEGLDELDMIEEEYMLEVSSPGIEKELKCENDIIKNINNYVHIDFVNHYPITLKNKVLELEGYLRNYSNNVFEIEYNNKGQIKKLLINKDEIKLIRLAVKF